jgi:hypothetical protein
MPTRARLSILVSLSLAFFTSACLAGNPDGGCPRPGLDSSRRCKRMCVLRADTVGRPLPCTCMAQCLCWQMPGHPRHAEEDPVFEDPRGEQR